VLRLLPCMDNQPSILLPSVRHASSQLVNELLPCCVAWHTHSSMLLAAWEVMIAGEKTRAEATRRAEEVVRREMYGSVEEIPYQSLAPPFYGPPTGASSLCPYYHIWTHNPRFYSKGPKAVQRRQRQRRPPDSAPPSPPPPYRQSGNSPSGATTRQGLFSRPAPPLLGESPPHATRRPALPRGWREPSLRLSVVAQRCITETASPRALR